VINQTKVFDEINSAADGDVRRIIAANGGPALARSAGASTPAASTATQASAAQSAVVPAAATALAGGGAAKLAIGKVNATNSRLLK